MRFGHGFAICVVQRVDRALALSARLRPIVMSAQGKPEHLALPIESRT
jgi:hypothetical protein